MTTPTYTVEVAWSGQLTGVFTIGTSTIGGSDVIAGDFGNNAFDDITDVVKELRCFRGRSNDMSIMQQGRSTIRLKDSDGTYNPENSGSSLNGYLVPMRPVRARATYSGTTYGLFHHYISRIEHDPQKKESIIEAVDFFEWLAAAKPTVAEQTNQTVDVLIGLILDAVGWTDPNMRSLGTSSTTVPTFSLDGGTAALSAIETLLRVDRGVFFIDGDGVATYVPRNTWFANGSAVATLSGSEIIGLRTGTEKASIINGQSCTKTGNTAQTATDATSRKNYAYRDGVAIQSAYFDSDATALAVARFIVAMNKDPRSPARQVLIKNGNATQLTQQLAREIGDLVTVDESKGGTNFNGRVQAIEHIIKNDPRVHDTRFVVEKASPCVFTIGTSTLDGADIIGL